MYAGAQDGVAIPATNPGQVYKNIDGVNVKVNPDGSVSVEGYWDWIRQKAAEALNRGGWEDENWLNGRHDAGDSGWDELFKKSKPPNDKGDPSRKDNDESDQ